MSGIRPPTSSPRVPAQPSTRASTTCGPAKASKPGCASGSTPPSATAASTTFPSASPASPSCVRRGRYEDLLADPVAEFGAIGKTMHKVDEQVPVADLEALARIYRRVLDRLFPA